MKLNNLYRYAVLAAVNALLLLLAACGANSRVMEAPQQQAVTSQVLTLSAGQSAQLRPGAKLTLERINDSRCKSGAVCVWAGYISYTFKLDSNTGSSTFVLSGSMPNGKQSQSADQLTFTLLGVEPEAPPAADAPTPIYRVTVKVAAI